MPLDQVEAMVSALQAHGCSVQETILQGHRHAIEYWETVAEEVFAFVKAH
jgi:dipeptidyl aminopeptidase/acylaminoacyl peptidase